MTIGHEQRLPRTCNDPAQLADGVQRGDRACERALDEIRELVRANFARLADQWCRGPRFEAIVAERMQACDPQRVADQLVEEALRPPLR